MKTHLTAHLSTSDRCFWIWVCESVCKCAAISPNVCICFHTVHMNHHVDWVESPSPCYKQDSARYLVIMYCMCVSCLRALHELHERIQRDICVIERGLSLLWGCLVFSLSLSRVKKTALSHVTPHSQSGLGSRAAEEHPARRATKPTFSLCALWLSERWAEKSRSAGMCVHVYDYTWWEEDVLFKRAVRLRSGNASDVALEAVRVFTFTTQQEWSNSRWTECCTGTHIRTNAWAFLCLPYAIL